MSDLFSEIAQIISNISNVPADKIEPSSHLLTDLQVDSLGILDATFDIEKKYGIKIPMEEWLVEMSSTNTNEFTMETLVNKIQQLVDGK